MEFYVLGPLRVVTGSGPLTIRAKRLRAVLAILLLHASDVVSMDRIIDGVWPREPPRSAVENVRTYVWQLRSLLCAAGDHGRLESHVGGYRLLAEPEDLDLLRFTTLAAEGRQALRCGDFISAAVILEQAMGLWRGDALPELELGPAIRARTVGLEEQRRSLEPDWISARLALGEHAQMVPVLRELTAERPLDESLWRYLVVVLHSMGRTAEALSAYAEARHHLVTELGIEPGTELQKAHLAILRGSEVPDVPPREATTVPGNARTKPRQLPAGDPGFVGRQAAVESVRRLVGQAQDRGVAGRAVAIVSGPPGVGKSATGLAAAAAVLPAFPDGQLYVDLRGSTDSPLGAVDALASVLDGLGLRPETLPETLDRRRALYRSLLAERRMLILLDDAACTSQVAPLVPGHGRSLLLVTSSRRLAGVEADVTIGLEPLSEDEALRMLGWIVGDERVRGEPAAARGIVEACGRLPLAIRVAADRLAARPEQPLGTFADRLRTSSRLLDELALDGLAVRTRFDASYRALDPSAQRCFRLLARLERAAITATGLGGLLRVPPLAADRELERLVLEGLLIPEVVHGGAPRYHMPGPLHLYAGERLALEGADLPAAYTRHGAGGSTPAGCACSHGRNGATPSIEPIGAGALSLHADAGSHVPQSAQVTP